MVAGVGIQEIRDKIDSDHWSARLLAEVVCSTYWGGAGVHLCELDRLNDESRKFAVITMGYRRCTPGWDDAKFYALACWCRERHNLAQWKEF